MKALVLAREGRKAVLLLQGGEMRTVRAKKEWQTGMEVSVRPYPLRKPKRKISLRSAFYPMAACAAAFLIVFSGLRLMSRNHIDHQQPIQPLSPGSAAATETVSPAPTAIPAFSDSPQPTPAPTDEQGRDGFAGQTEEVQQIGSTPQPQRICDECGQPGHDDDECPNEKCDECGQTGHDDDDCPNEKCDECGQTGHDDDDCPDAHRSGHHDD